MKFYYNFILFYIDIILIVSFVFMALMEYCLVNIVLDDGGRKPKVR